MSTKLKPIQNALCAAAKDYFAASCTLALKEIGRDAKFFSARNAFVQEKFCFKEKALIFVYKSS